MTDAARMPSRARLRQMATGGAASIGVSVGATNLLRIVSTMTLTRLLDSHAYGVVGVITTISYMVGMISDIGLVPFIIGHQDRDEKTFLDQLWTVCLVRGFSLAVMMALISGPLADFLGKPELGLVLAVWGFIFVLDGVQSLAHITAVRHGQLWRLSLLDLLTNVVSFLVSLTMAFVLRSYWAIIIGMFGGALMRAAFSYKLFADSGRRWNYNSVRPRELWQFSRYITLSSMLTLVIMQSDKVLLARLMPLPVFGLYAIAVTLATAPSAIAIPYVMRVLYPIYADTVRNRSAAALRQVFYDSRRKVALLYMFATGGVIGSAPMIIGLLYDARYWGVVPFLRLIMISAVLRLASAASEQVLVATGRTRANLIANIFRISWLVAGGIVGLATGNILLLVAIVGTIEVPGLLCNWVNLKRAGLFNLKEEIYGLVAAGAGVGIGYAAALLTAGMMPEW